ncbi:MAG: sugar porter family MFS transporter [Planctomycetes bacterium]|jgi:sugar porter (SP) family MFS transporter|nr:sugar porter family MFS transporter [Planctomycetota bacterium]
MEADVTLVQSDGRARYNMPFIWLICSVAALGGLLFGWDWVVIGGAKPFFEPFFGIAQDAVVEGVPKMVTDGRLSGWANSCALLGCLVGALAAGGLSDKFGRKKLLIFSAFLFAASSALTGWAGSLNQFILWRITGGVAIGMASNLSPLYIAEVAPAPLRGRLVTLNQLTIVFGILAAQLLNLVIARDVAEGATAQMIAQSWNGQYGWRWMFTLVAAPAAAFFLLAFLVPESPRWLVKNGQDELARRVLARIGGAVYAQAETADIRQTIAAEEVARVRLSTLLEPKMVRVLLIGCGLAVLQQWSGINVLFNYAQNIFQNAGFGVNTILLFIVITGQVNMAFTFVALGTVDHWGRRSLMLFGCAGIAASHVLIGLAYAMELKGLAVLIFALAAIGCYGMSLAPVTWVLISEIFPNRIRGTAISVAVSALWIACFLLTYTFPILERNIGTGNTFWIYAAICAVGFVFVRACVPETKGKSLEDIERQLVDG